MSTSTITAAEVIPAGTWSVDPVHTTIAFQVTDTSDLFSSVNGRFTAFEGRIRSDGQTSIEGAIRVDSLRTDNEQRDAHLISPDFLEAAKHPEIRFESTSLEPVGDDRFAVRGRLFVKEQPFEVELQGRVRAHGTGKAGDERIVLDVDGSFDWGTTTVEITAGVSATKQV